MNEGGAPEMMDPRWRIHSVALKSVGLEFVHLHKLDTRNSRLRSMLGLGQIYFASGDAVGTAAAYNVSRELVYPAKYVASLLSLSLSLFWRSKG
jgi:hypothetical protein